MTKTKSTKFEQDDDRKPRIAIVGGGIAGVTAANALGNKFKTIDTNGNNSLSIDIVVFEGCVECGHCVNFAKSEQPTWIAGMYDVVDMRRNGGMIYPFTT